MLMPKPYFVRPAAVGCDVGTLSCRGAKGHRVPVVAHAALVAEGKESDHGTRARGFQGELEIVSPGMVDLVVEDVAVARRRHLVAAEDKSPGRMNDRDGGADGVAPRVGRIVPCRIVKKGVVEELGPLIVRVAVQVEIVRGG